MKKLIKKAEGMDFKKVFIGFFAAVVVFGLVFTIVMSASGYGADVAAFWERLTFARLRGRMFTDIAGTFRFFGYLLLIGFHGLLALWVAVDSKRNGQKTRLHILTLFTGIIGYLVYMIKREEREKCQL